ncbi:hypothetical protein D3C87_1870220 [compost metagenome]
MFGDLRGGVIKNADAHVAERSQKILQDAWQHMGGERGQACDRDMLLVLPSAQPQFLER